MITQKRLTQIETSLPPKLAVKLWLQHEYQGKTRKEYADWLIMRSATAAPRIRVERQVAVSVQEAMRGSDPARVGHAVRQSKMETDFLILLVCRSASVICDRSRSGLLQLASVVIRAQDSSVVPDDDTSHDCDSAFREAVAELLSNAMAVEQIQARYFDGECILPKDVKEILEFNTIFVRGFVNEIACQQLKDGPSEPLDSEDFRDLVAAKASEKALYIQALAKSEMLQCFGAPAEANVILRQYMSSER